MDRASFTNAVRDALTHIEDDRTLVGHDLARWLGREGASASAEALRRELLGAVDEAGRLTGRADDDVRQRQHRQLVLRYLDGHRRDEVAAMLGVSIRQATRDLDAAVAAVAALLWRRRFGSADDSRADGERDLDSELTALVAQEEGASDLATIVEGALATLRNLAALSATSFSTTVLDGLPAVALGHTVLRQVVLNTLMYALAVAPGCRLSITATDTASGIVVRLGTGADGVVAPPTDAPEAETLFATARRLLASQGGAIERGEAAGASLVRIVLPPVALRKVLVVDDNPDVVRLFQRYLAGEPYRLIQATSADGARRLALELRPDVILLDVMLPSRDGWEILQDLRDEPATRDIPVIVCSILPERTLALSLGVADFLPKPVTAASLRSALAQWCPVPGARSAPL